MPSTFSSSRNIRRLKAVLLVPGLASTLLALPLPFSLPLRIPTSRRHSSSTQSTASYPISPSRPSFFLQSILRGRRSALRRHPFLPPAFSHACPTRAPGDTNRMHSVLNTFFRRISSEEKKRSLQERVAGLFLSGQLACYISRADVSHYSGTFGERMRVGVFLHQSI